MKILVVGAVAGGATAIARLRRLDESAEIIIFERGKYVSYANCGLPYYVGGVIERRDALFVSTKESIEKKYAIDIRTENEVMAIHPEKKTVTVKDLSKGTEYEESYDKLLLSTGSKPFIPPVPGLDADNVFQLWTVPDTDRITAFIEKRKPKTAVVVGGGFIGLEMAENLAERGISVSIADLADQVMPPFDKDMAKLVENHLLAKGVKLLLGRGFKGLEDGGRTVIFESGEKVAADMVILSIGVRPNNELAKAAGLELIDRGGIVVDEFGQTSNPDIYAVGDVTAVKDFVSGATTMIPLAGPANKQGRAVCANLLGEERKEPYVGTLGTSVAKVFDLTCASTGSSEKLLQRAGKVYGKDYFYTVIHPMSHAGYYPGALPMTIKLIFAADGKVLGAQIVGYDGVDKRIDTIAGAMHFRGTVTDLTQLEFAYAPPYSSAKDPVNFAGYSAENILTGRMIPITTAELLASPSEYTILDVREKEETVSGTLPGAINIPLTELRERLSELKKDKKYVLYCAVGVRGYIAQRILQHHGFRTKNLIGGYRTYNDLTTDCSSTSCCTAGAVGSTDQEKFERKEAAPSETVKLNVCGLSCPGPIVEVSKALEKLKEGDVLEVVATDPGFSRDIERWCANTGNTFLSNSQEKGKFGATIRKGAASAVVKSESCSAPPKKEKTMIVFDGDLDKAIAAFIIATGAAAMGNKVHMFFTFWGLSILRKPSHAPVKKDFMSRMFGWMLPKGSKKLKLSQMNFMGAGAGMIRGIMKKKGVASLEELIRQAQEAGVEMTACQMSMDVMGLTKEELIDGVEIGGVATMLDDNDRSNMNLFI